MGRAVPNRSGGLLYFGLVMSLLTLVRRSFTLVPGRARPFLQWI